MTANRIRFLTAVAVTLLLAFAPRPPQADSNAKSEVVFLTLEISDAGVSLVEWNTVAGTVKHSRRDNLRSPLTYSVQSAAGSTLWRGGLDDPRIVRIESYSTDPPGTITPHVFRRDTAQFTIRVPYDPSIDRIEFSRQSRVERNGNVSTDKASLATIVWPSTRTGKRP